jgi:branched-subunit amino acid transport protein
MRKAMPFLTVAALAALFVSGCTVTEPKLGRGIKNYYIDTDTYTGFSNGEVNIVDVVSTFGFGSRFRVFDD